MRSSMAPPPSILFSMATSNLTPSTPSWLGAASLRPKVAALLTQCSAAGDSGKYRKSSLNFWLQATSYFSASLPLSTMTLDSIRRWIETIGPDPSKADFIVCREVVTSSNVSRRNYNLNVWTIPLRLGRKQKA
ncbi:hypothetical protein EYF80_057637 [Liparis tanakae]|uniref:Uncharacterized protein n=1 Tax=Liparis tanakae TaxID=230148 RepID=A0A4Z2ETG6_9TELE|nr:hypothetical protein EYF80_057637 [Liparis tanakae]